MSEEPEDDEAALFRAAMRDVRRLDARPRPTIAHRTAPPRARFARAARRESQIGILPGAAADLEVAGADRLSFRRPGVQESVLRKLRRDQFPIGAEIDLHGLTAAQAEAELRRFLGSALARGVVCVRIVHGKGHRSGDRGPVLKATVNALLKRSPPVLAFTSASPRAGGSGATTVLLRAPQ